MGIASSVCISCHTPVPTDARFCPTCGARTPTQLGPEAGESRDAALRAALADRYRIDHRLGAGGMGTVYLAHDVRHDRDVALKVLRADVAQALGRARFLREIRLAARLNHPNILPLYDSGEADGFLYFVMPVMEGLPLRDRLRAERVLPVDDAVRIAVEVADALDY
ncbi:MAG TPA: serine/threonine-protein kinase, partial [Frankiaceae bacterium]|nr:serine/threonine-protein kinase [Frankiaceae bacterium]